MNVKMYLDLLLLFISVQEVLHSTHMHVERKMCVENRLQIIVMKRRHIPIEVRNDYLK